MAGGNDPVLGPGEIDDGEIEEAEIDEGDAGGEIEPGDEGDASVGEDADGDETQGQARDVGRQGRPSRDTIRNLRRRAQEAEEGRRQAEQDFNRRLADLETRQRQSVDPMAAAREEAEEQARVELMTPAQVARYYADKSERRVAQVLQGQSFSIQDRIDKQSFDAAAAGNPLLARLAPKVETVLAQERAAGRNTDRLVVAKYLLGDEMLTRRNTQLLRQRAGAQRRVASQAGRPLNGAGDAQRQGGRQGDDSYEAALRRTRGVTL